MTRYLDTRSGTHKVIPRPQWFMGDAPPGEGSDAVPVTDDYLVSVGIFPIVDAVIPPGKVAVAWHYAVAVDHAEETATLADAPPPPVPDSISDRQFAQQLAMLGTITWDEATAWAARGDLPDILEAALSNIPVADNQQAIARHTLMSARDFDRHHPLTAMLGSMLNYNDAALDEIWRAGALL